MRTYIDLPEEELAHNNFIKIFIFKNKNHMAKRCDKSLY